MFKNLFNLALNDAPHSASRWKIVKKNLFVMILVDKQDICNVLSKTFDIFDWEYKLLQGDLTHEDIHALIGVQFAVFIDLFWSSIKPADQ